MIEHRIGNVLEETDIEVILHQANLYHTFGNGIARAIKEKYPEAYAADCKTVNGDSSKLGTYSTAQASNGKIIVNVYSQTGMGASDRNTSYNDVLAVFRAIEKKCVANARTIGIPYKFGCGLAGGSWRIINAIIEEVFKNSPVKCVIVRLANEPEIDLS